MNPLTETVSRQRRVLMVHDRARLARGSDVAFQEQRRTLREAGYGVYSFTFDPAGGGNEHDVVYRENRRPTIRKAYRYTFNVGVYGALRRLVERARPDLIVLNTYYNYPLSVLAACRGRLVLHVQHSAPLVCPNLSLRQRRGRAKSGDGMPGLRAQGGEDRSMLSPDLAQPQPWHAHPCAGWFGWQCLRAGCVSPPEWAVLVGLYTAWPALSRQWVACHAAVSRPLAKSLRRRGMRDVRLLPLYVDTAQFVPAPYPARPVRLLYVGHVSAEKGVLDLFDAFRQVHRRHPGARLTVAGSGPARGQLEALAAEAGLADTVEFPGQVSHAAVGRLMAESAVVVMPSRSYEGFGLVGVEAMASGRPVVGTRVGGIAEWLADGETGFLVEPGDVAALADRIGRLLDDPASAAQMGRRGRDRAERLFDVSVFRRRFLDLVADLLRTAEP